MKILRWSLIVVVIGGIAFVAANRRFILGLWQYGGQAKEGKLRVGDPAPRVTVWDLDGQHTHDLGEYFGRNPLVLVFGSFT